MDVLYTIDNRFKDLMLGSFLSLYCEGGFNSLRLHIVCENFSKEDYLEISRFLDAYEVSYELIPLEKIDISKYNIPMWRGSNIANARLFLSKIINLDDISHLLYLDADTIVFKKISSIHNYDDNTISMVKDEAKKSYYTKLGLSKYYNSGVIYINVKKWIDEKIEEEFLKTISKGYKIEYPDQDIINLSLNGMIGELPLGYNISPTAFTFNDFLNHVYYSKLFRDVNINDLKQGFKDPKILHSYGYLGAKPWCNQAVNPYNDIFMKYILFCNPDFTKEELSKLRSFFTSNELLFKMCLMYNGCCDGKLYHGIKKLLKKDL